MRIDRLLRPRRLIVGTRRRLSKLRTDTSGSVALEFAEISVPFLMMLIGIMGTGLQYFSLTSLENGVEAASRAVLTGRAQLGDPNATPPVPPTTYDQFRQTICSTAGSFIKCDDAHLSLIVKSWSNWASVTQQSCNNSGALPPSTGSGSTPLASNTGAAGDVVLITVCYKWDMTSGWLVYAPVKLSDGSVLMQAATAFRTEPYQ